MLQFLLSSLRLPVHLRCFGAKLRPGAKLRLVPSTFTRRCLLPHQHPGARQSLVPSTFTRLCLVAAFLCSLGPPATGQSPPAENRIQAFLAPSDTLHKGRLWLLAGGGAAAYTATSIGLYSIWYKDYPLGKFHFFDDYGEWENMDKAGHLFTAYAESYLAYKGARWTGIQERPAAWIGAGVGTLLQATIEVMDGFSEGWGFSTADFAFNTAGVGLFLGQELLWQDQRVMVKVSHTRPNYGSALLTSSTGVTRTIDEAATILYGKFPASFVKDYNAMTVWASVNPASFFPKKKKLFFPRWLNIAGGYGAQNVYGAYGNAITDSQGNVFFLHEYPRYRQYYLSLDADLRRIPTRSRALRTLFTALSWIKLPSPTIEWNSLGEQKFYWLYW